MAFTDFIKLSVFYNGNVLTSLTSISFTTEGGHQRVDLLNEGLAGFTPGSGSVEIEIGFAIPIGGTQEPFQQHCSDGVIVEMQVPVGNVDYIGLGKIMHVKFSQSTSQNVEGSFLWSGQLKPMG